MFESIEDLRERIHRYGFEEFEEKLIKMVEPSIAMITDLAEDETLPIGCSKLGGNPDLTGDFEWPYWHDKPLTFVAQINLSELAQATTQFDNVVSEGMISPDLFQNQHDYLPQEGMLYFFFEADEMPYGAYEDQGKWQVVYKPSDSILQRTSHPAYQGEFRLISAFQPQRLSFQPALSLPFDVHLSILTPLGIEERNFPRVNDLLEFLNDDETYLGGCCTYFYGHSHSIQGVAKRDCICDAHQLYYSRAYDTPAYVNTDGQIVDIDAIMNEWQFLFQITSYPSTNMNWGYQGDIVYVCIPKASLAAKRFEDCWAIIQTT